METVLDERRPPSSEELVTELRLLREKGLTQLSQLQLPALLRVAQLVTADVEGVDHGALVETLLRRAVARLGGGKYGEAVASLLGLDPDTRVLRAGVRRARAAIELGVSVSTLRRKHERAMLGQVARQILNLYTEQHMSTAHQRRERRHPAESGMALHWIDRFQAYYRMWTPIYALGADLTAYRSTLLENPRPYDRRFGTEGPEDEGYSQDEQAEGYATYALYHYALFEWDLRQFISRYGGLWLLSDAEDEQAVTDVVTRIGWHTPFNERDQSFLRTLLDETPNQELHGFVTRLADLPLGEIAHDEWQQWVAACACVVDARHEPRYESSADPRRPDDSLHCPVHAVIAACSTYCALIDRDWAKIADWYRLPRTLREESVGGLPQQLYAGLRAGVSPHPASAAARAR